MNDKKVRRAGRRIQLRHLTKRFKESGTFDPAVFESRSQSSDPPQDITILWYSSSDVLYVVGTVHCYSLSDWCSNVAWTLFFKLVFPSISFLHIPQKWKRFFFHIQSKDQIVWKPNSICLKYSRRYFFLRFLHVFFFRQCIQSEILFIFTNMRVITIFNIKCHQNYIKLCNDTYYKNAL